MLNIYLIRHGQNLDNVNKILNGRRDEPLTELGVSQAQATARHLLNLGLHFDAVYTSPLSRARETAEIITTFLHIPPANVLEDLIERDFGVMTGKPLSFIVPLCAPEIIQTDTITYFLSPEGAETFPQLMDRSRRLLLHVKELHKDGNILLVSHGDIGKMIYASFYDLDWRDTLTSFHFGNADILLLSEDSSAEEPYVFRQAQYNH